jgi:uncharacterized protein (TIGR02996 family)
MSDEQAFLNALIANPTDDVCRLAYSDWLEERNELGKATYLRLVVRAVEQITSGEELGATRDGLWPLITTLDEDWRNAVGRRFDVRLKSVPSDRKLAAIKSVREGLGCGLAEAVRIIEVTPHQITGGCRIEVVISLRVFFLPNLADEVEVFVTDHPANNPNYPLQITRPHRIIVTLRGNYQSPRAVSDVKIGKQSQGFWPKNRPKSYPSYHMKQP